MKACAYLLVFFVVGIAEAQTPHFERYFVTRNNESVQINKIFQSREGYIWFATTKGLYRFDGERYRSFGIADSLPDLNITALAQDSLGRIWTGHASGKISVYHNNRFNLFQPEEGLSSSPVSDILFDADNVLWFSTLNDGLYYYVNKRLYRLDEENGLPDLYVYDIEQGQNNEMYAGTDGGLVICNRKGQSTDIRVVSNKHGLPDNIVRKIHSLDNGTLLLATEDKGVIEFDRQSNAFKSITQNTSLTAISDIVVTSGKVWVASAETGLAVVDLKSGMLKRYPDENGKPLPIMSCLLVDNERNIWSGSRNGIFRTLGDELEFVPVPVTDRDANVMAVTTDRDGAIWFSTEDGLFKRTKTSAGNYTTTSILDGSPYERYRVISLYVDDNGFVWAGLYGEGVLRIDPGTKKITRLAKELRNGNVLSISRGAGNSVWLATLGGAEKIEIKGNDLKVSHYSSENGLSSDFIYQVFVDSKNRVWFATDGRGVDMIDGAGIHHLEKGLASKVIYGFAEDASGRIWVNTQDSGIFYVSQNEFVDSRSDSVGFRELNNYVLTSDRAGRIVTMHNGGIDIFDPVAKSIRYLDENSGLGNRVANLNSAFRASDHILFGTSGGLVLLNFNLSPRIFPKIHIEGVSIVGKKHYLDLAKPLPHSENNLTISFRAFWYQNPEDVAFEYRMDNYDEDWITTGDDQITYSQLPPGDYTFHVRALNSEVQGDSTIRFSIRPPFWKTAGFLMAVAVSIALVIYAYIKYRERALLEAKRILEQKVEERTREIQRNVEEIQAQNEEIMAQAEEIKGINENLEMLVRQRTAELERKNQALEEYAFINAHKLRSPVASILGLVNLLNKSEMNDECKVINRHLLDSADELDGIVRSITKAIERGDHKS
ncbi:MAG TPA: two-component regulator propeller domain-containing protein [Chryseosolibacter sp.]